MLKSIIQEIPKAIEPITYASNSDAFVSLLHGLGWALPDIEVNIDFPRIDALLNDYYATFSTLDQMSFTELIRNFTQLTDKTQKVLIDLKRLPSILEVQLRRLNDFPLADVQQNIVRRLLDFLIVRYLQTYQKKTYSALQLFGIVQFIIQDENTTAYLSKARISKVNWEQIPIFLKEPNTALKLIYQWGEENFDAGRLFSRIQYLFNTMYIPARILRRDFEYGPFQYELKIPFLNQIFKNNNGDANIIELGILLRAKKNNSNFPSLEVELYSDGGFDFSAEKSVDMGHNWEFKPHFDVSAQMEQSLKLSINPPPLPLLIVSLDGQQSIETNLTLEIGQNEEESRTPKLIFGSNREEETRLTYNRIIFKPSFRVKGNITNTGIFIEEGAGEGDGPYEPMPTTPEPTEPIPTPSSEQGEANSSIKIDINALVKVEGFNFHLRPGNDSFLSAIIKPVDTNIDIGLLWSNQNGLTFSGSGTLDIPIPTHQTFGPVTLSEIVLAIGLADRGLAFKAGASIAAKLGPLNIGVKEMGVKFDVDFPENANGNLGLLNLAPGIKPPKGISLGLDSGGFRGGGFLHLDYDKGEYSGGFELNYQNQFNVKAIAVLNTKGVEGGGFSLFILLTAEFTPAFQLGFGFALKGVGGMLGLHRRIDQSAMREAVRSRALSHLLFPKGETADIVSQAPAIISAANSVFPAQNDNFVFGPMAKIIWGPDNAEILNVELGLIIQTNPVALAVIGLLRCTLPNKHAPLIDLRMVFAGGIDTSKKLIWFDAQLIESRIIGYTATGSMRLRIAYGDKPDFVLSVGGFHPSYNPPARLELGLVDRMAIRMFESDNVQLRAESYFALTSNTVQFGGAVWLKAKFWKLNVNGDLTYNVLFQFNPFHFYADVHLNLSIKVWKLHFYAGVNAVLEGPNPWKLTGNISIEMPSPFPDIDVDFEVEWGDENKEIAPSIAVYPLLETALGAPHNWSSLLPDPALFQETLRPQESGTLVLHPFGQLRITQQVIPLNVKVSRLGTLDIVDTGTYSISRVIIGDSTMVHKSVQTAFAPAQFGDHSDAEKLALEGYQNMDSGVERNWAGNDYDFDFGVPCPEARELTYEPGFDTSTSLNLKGNRDSAYGEEKALLPDTKNTSELKLEGAIQHLLNNNQMKESKLSSKLRNASALSMKKTEFLGEKYALINANGAFEGKPVIFKLREIKDSMLKRYEGRFKLHGITKQFDSSDIFNINNLGTYKDRLRLISSLSSVDTNTFLDDVPLMKGDEQNPTPVIQLKLISNLLETGDSKDNAQEKIRIPKYMLRTIGDKY